MVKTLERHRYALCEKHVIVPFCCSYQVYRYLAGCFGLISCRHYLEKRPGRCTYQTCATLHIMSWQFKCLQKSVGGGTRYRSGMKHWNTCCFMRGVLPSQKLSRCLHKRRNSCNRCGGRVLRGDVVRASYKGVTGCEACGFDVSLRVKRRI